jgi:putative drug exporter of the RND superfamily
VTPTDSQSSLQAAPRRLPWTVRVASWSARHRWLVFALWLVATIGTFGVSRAMGGIKAQGATGGNNGFATTEASQGLQVLEDANRSKEPGEQFVAVITLPATDTADQRSAMISDAVAKLAATSVDGAPVFTAGSVIDPTTVAPAAGLVSPDGTSVQIPARIPITDTAQLDAIRTTLDELRAAHPEAEIHSVSFSMINDDINAVVFSDLDRSLLLTIPATFLILLIAFGAFAASVVPLVLALTSLLAAFGLLGIYSQLLNPVSPYATQLVVLIGLAVAIDYSLFMITRFRSERRSGHDTLTAIEIASSTAGRAVFFSGLAVMISVAALFVLPDELFHSMALGTIAVILVSVIGSLTFLPALLAILGKRIDFGRLPWVSRDRGESGGFWSHVVTAVMRRPAIAAIGATAFLLLLAWPAISLRLGTTDITAFPESVDGVAAIEQLREHWPQGSLLTLDAIVTNAQDPGVQAAIEKLKTAGLTISGLSEPVKVTPSADGTVADVSFVMAGTENDPANAAIVREMRSRVVPEVFGGISGTRVYISGDAAASMDRTDTYTSALPEVFAFVLGLSFLLLLVAFRSIVIPIKAIALNLLSTAAAYGVLVAVFEQGFAKDLLGVRPTDVIEAWVPIFIFAILFGLSMDYHVFILSRVKELVDKGMATTDAVAKGIASTSGTVTSAAAIMVVVFAVFATLRLVIIRELGLGLAVAVLIDATVIRSILLPATMRLLGEWNWYLPRWLNWLPHVSIEVEEEHPLSEVGGASA